MIFDHDDPEEISLDLQCCGDVMNFKMSVGVISVCLSNHTFMSQYVAVACALFPTVPLPPPPPRC